MKTLLVITVVGVVCALLLIFGIKTRNQMKRVKTLDTMGQVLVALDKTLPTNQSQTMNPVAAAQSEFPSIPTMGHDIVDAWGRPINISIKKIEKGFAVDIVSSGPDGIIGTKDDLVRNEIVLLKMP